MPKPLITILLLSIASLLGVAAVVLLLSPYQPGANQMAWPHITIFLTVLFSAISFNLTLISFLAGQTLFGRFTSPRQKLRAYLKRSAILGLGTTALVLMRLTDTLNPITVGLLVLTILSLLHTRRN